MHIENKSLIIKHYDGDPRELIECTEKNEVHKECGRFFCHFCLKGSYDTIVDEVKTKKDWLCPYCTGVCFCSRCTRFDKILKLIGLYVSLGGELNELYDNLITKSGILDKLNNHMLLSNLIVANNDSLLEPIQIMKNISKVNEKSIKKINDVIGKCDSYRDNLNNIKSYYDKLFLKAQIDKCLLVNEKDISDICLDNNDSCLFLNKKRNRNKKNKIINVAQEYYNKGRSFKQKHCKTKDKNEEEDNDENNTKLKDKKQRINRQRKNEIKHKGRPRKNL